MAVAHPVSARPNLLDGFFRGLGFLAPVRPVVAANDVLDRILGLNRPGRSLFFTPDEPAERQP